MSLVRNAIYDNGQVRYQGPGDLNAGNEVILQDATNGNLTITGALMATGILRRTGSAANYADVFPTAADLVNALLNNAYLGGGAVAAVGVVPAAFRFRILNTVAFTNTPTIGAGGTLVGGNTAIAASSWKDYLITITNGTPGSVVAGNTTNASAVVTGMNPGLLQYVTQGQLVTGTGIPGGTTVASVQPGVGITLSANATATNAGTALTFGPTYTVQSLGGGSI